MGHFAGIPKVVMPSKAIELTEPDNGMGHIRLLQRSNLLGRKLYRKSSDGIVEMILLGSPNNGCGHHWLA